MTTDVIDKFKRPLKDLRVSVTDRCNFRCPYCMPAEIYGERYSFLPKKELLSFEEISRVAQIAVDMGVNKLRLTGGEPLVREGIEELVAMLARIDGVEDLAMTTNAYLLKAKADILKNAGLKRITVSLDSLDEEVFQRMNGRGFGPAKVLDGISAAKEVGLLPIKVNTVVKKGVNEHTLVALADYCRTNQYIPRFIEYMDVGTLNGWRKDDVVSANEIVEMIDAVFPLQPIEPSYKGEVATRYKYVDGRGEIGVISSVSQPFCGDCTRLRLSPEGQLVTCLFAEKGTDLRSPMREGASDNELRRIIEKTWKLRDDRYSEERAQSTKARTKVEMYHIGG